MQYSKNSPFQKLDLSRIVTYAINSRNVREAAAWLRNSSDLAMSGEGYPTKEEMDTYRVTPLGYLVLSGMVSSYPGGGANPLTQEGVAHQLARVNYLSRGAKNLEFEILLGGHVCASPTYKGSTDEFLSNPKVPQELIRRIAMNRGSSIVSQYFSHLNLLHSLSNCGLSNGREETLRERLGEQIGLVLNDVRGQKNINVLPLEAIVGQTNHEMNESSLSYEAFNFHNNSKIGFYMHPHNKTPLSAPNESEFMNFQQVNNYIMGLMDKGVIIIGAVCLDRRMGATLPHDRVNQVAPYALGGHLSYYKKVPIVHDFQNTRHTEFPVWALLTGEDDLNPTSLAYYLMNQGLHLLQEYNSETGSKLLAPAGVGLVSIPLGMPLDKFAPQLYGLLSNLEHEIYQAGHIAGQPFRRSTTAYIKTSVGIIEIDYPDGLHIMCPDTEKGHEASELQVVHPLLQKGAGLHPNPPVKFYYPGSRHKVLRQISNYLNN